ncbi:L-aspartate oxidase [Natroniella sulfidigena]|uniref:L-aspartate oxidase n=1 Tax=Natroniella sulfidigena TaxID=723921 RepID=UPI00200B9FB2|nr:L-aspartate oxidase [Natroniella sulfidigena]MCK8817314.1 L-aspartate oxidase [Natroniella sulfidigena]
MIPRYLTNFNLQQIEQIKTDFLVIGSGIAGLYSGLKLANRGKVRLLTKGKLKDCNTEYAQGGIAAAIATNDNPKLHYLDTLRAGAGLTNSEAVSTLTDESQERIEELIEIGVEFDQANGELALTKEGAHSCCRVLHAGGDATGAEIRKVLGQQVQKNKRIKVDSEIFAIDLLTENNRCYGILAYDQKQEKYLAYLAQAVILATGGAGQLYAKTSNPAIATGDGIAMAYRAGVEVMDLEFIQFHPTTLELAERENFLISEAVRGEGAILRNQAGKAFMTDYHHLAELAPRDIVARAIYQEIKNSSDDHLYLDVTELDPNYIKERFPTIYRTCLEAGVDISKDYIPIAPAAHYLMGGVKVNLNGESSLAGLFVCGEAAAMGLHGANRLASNSLLEALVYGKKVADRAATFLDEPKMDFNWLQFNYDQQVRGDIPAEKIKNQIQSLMMEQAGIVRNELGLKKALAQLSKMTDYLKMTLLQIEEVEVQNLIIVAYLAVKAALIRTESRGAHYRSDFPEKNSKWNKHICLKKENRQEEFRVEVN